MSRPDPIEYAEQLYSAISAANFSPISFLAFGNAVKDGVPFRNMPRMAAEPFMRVVGEMLDLEEEAAEEEEIVDGELAPEPTASEEPVIAPVAAAPVVEDAPAAQVNASEATEAPVPAQVAATPAASDRRRSRR